MTFEPRRRSGPSSARPGVLEDISSAYDSPATTVDDWVVVIGRQQLADDGAAVRALRRDRARSSPTTSRDPSTSCSVAPRDVRRRSIDGCDATEPGSDAILAA